jgi:phage protein U
MIMAMWGPYAFELNTAVFQELQRGKEWRWPEQELFGQSPLLQFTGEGAETITLPGIIYPEWKGGTGQINEMRALADEALPRTLIDGRGNILGLWVATSIQETQSNFGGLGIPRRQEFTLSLKRFPDTAATGNVGLNALTKIAKKAGIDVNAIKSMISKIQSAAGQLKAAIQQAQATAQAVQGVIGAPYAAINQATQLAQNVANDYKVLAQSAESLVTAPATTAAGVVAGANAAVATIVEGTPTLTSTATACAKSLKTSLGTVIGLGVAPSGVIATRACMVSANKLTNNLSNTFHESKGTVVTA